MWQKAPLEPFSMLTSQQIVKYCLFSPPFLFLANHVWRLMCRHCARSCKINSCIFKRDANESAWWTGLLAWNLIRSVVPFANEFTFPLCLSLSLFFFALFHFPCPLQPIMRVHVMNSKSLVWQLKKKKKKKVLPFQTPISYFIQQSGCCLQRKRDRERRRRIYRDFGCLFLVILLPLLLILPRTQTGGFLSQRRDSPWPRDREDSLSTFLWVGWVVRSPPHYVA